MVETSIVPGEVEQFGKLADDWWDPRGASAMLHKLNPVRLGYVRDWIDQHWSLDEHSRRPLEGKSGLDVGCGAGLLAEPLARLGAKVTAVDPAAELIAAARDHAAERTRENTERYESARRELEQHWYGGLKRIQAPIEHGGGNGQPLLNWSDTGWQKWIPPKHFASQIRFGELVLNLALHHQS